MKHANFLIMFSLIVIVFLSGCIGQKSTSDQAKEACVELCKNAQMNLSDGPCLANNDQWEFEHWVCDVAHYPREAVDDLEENQCQGFRNMDAEFFVEVSEDCKIINSNCCY